VRLATAEFNNKLLNKAMKQLLKHIVTVKYSFKENFSHKEAYNLVDPNDRRRMGFNINQWLAEREGNEVNTKTLEIVRAE
jgi:uncharacterized damage-inducible protein DinB